MKRDGLTPTLFAAFGAGALTMYFADPNHGRRRRATLRDVFVHSGHEVKRFAQRFGREGLHQREICV